MRVVVCLSHPVARERRGATTDLKHPERSKAVLHLRLPEGFPEQYREGIFRAMELCAVKRRLGAAPSVEVAGTGGD